MTSQMGTQRAPYSVSAVQSATALEHEWIEAVSKRDTIKFDHFLAEGFHITTPFGVFTKRQCLELLMSDELILESISRDGETMLHNYGDEAVVHDTLTVKGAYRGRDISGRYRYRYAEAYSKWSGRWQAINCQAHPVL
jgi:hypothetical protein